MKAAVHFQSMPRPCSYLPDQTATLEYVQVTRLSPEEYHALMLLNWRRFGRMLFRPICSDCNRCRSLRVPVARFRPDRSQRRCRQANAGRLHLEIGTPRVSDAILDLYDRYHAFQTEKKDWPEHPTGHAESFADSFVRQPFPVEEWRYFLGDRLIGVGYVDALPGRKPGCLPLVLEGGEPLAGGLSAIYFFYDPEQRQFSPGTWNVLCLIDEAARRGLPHVYLGYHVEGCGDMVYKARFRPNEIRREDGVWTPWLD